MNNLLDVSYHSIHFVSLMLDKEALVVRLEDNVMYNETVTRIYTLLALKKTAIPLLQNLCYRM